MSNVIKTPPKKQPGRWNFFKQLFHRRTENPHPTNRDGPRIELGGLNHTPSGINLGKASFTEISFVIVAVLLAAWAGVGLVTQILVVVLYAIIVAFLSGH